MPSACSRASRKWIFAAWPGTLRDSPRRRRLAGGHRRLRGVEWTALSQSARLDYELRNMHTVTELIAHTALARRESRGGHYRSDFPEPSPAFQKHSAIRMGGDVRFV